LLPTYAEVSPTGTGIKLLVKGRISRAVKTDTVELYSKNRYFTITGHRLTDAPSSVVACPDALRRLHRRFRKRPARHAAKPTGAVGWGPRVGGGYALADQLDDAELTRRARDSKRNGAAFVRLWAGDAGGYTSRSEADAALVNHLLYWTNGDLGRVDRLFRQ